MGARGVEEAGMEPLLVTPELEKLGSLGLATQTD